MTTELASKSVLVAGATGGIGLPLCSRLAGSGYRLLLAARDSDRLREVSTRLPGGPHDWISVDMGSDESVEAFAVTLAEKDHPLDGLVLMPPQADRSSDYFPSNEVWRQNLQRSFVGPLALLKVAVTAMRPDVENGQRAKIVIISSIASAQVIEHYALSNALRCAWVGQAKTMAFGLGKKGIHVNTLSLGGVLTPGYSASLERRAAEAGVTVAARYAEETANIPLRKYATPEEVAVAVESLLSAFSDHMTGANLMFDGGFTRSY